MSQKRRRVQETEQGRKQMLAGVCSRPRGSSWSCAWQALQRNSHEPAAVQITSMGSKPRIVGGRTTMATTLVGIALSSRCSRNPSNLRGRGAGRH